MGVLLTLVAAVHCFYMHELLLQIILIDTILIWSPALLQGFIQNMFSSLNPNQMHGCTYYPVSTSSQSVLFSWNKQKILNVLLNGGVTELQFLEMQSPIL